MVAILDIWNGRAMNGMYTIDVEFRESLAGSLHTVALTMLHIGPW